jgi:hypothetical protein
VQLLNKHKYYFIITILSFCLHTTKISYSQNIDAISLQPEISIDYMLNSKLCFNFNHYWLSGNMETLYPEGGKMLASKSQHTISATYYINKKLSLGAAYELKIDYLDSEAIEYTNRSIEAIQLYLFPGKLKINQRLQFEQHYNESIVFRNRYRISLKYPIYQNSNGINMLSAIVSEELLWSINTETHGKLSQRFIAGFEYKWNSLISSRIGAQWRTKNIGQTNSCNILIGEISLSFNLHEAF